MDIMAAINNMSHNSYKRNSNCINTFDDFSLNIYRGDFCTILGSKMSGKSTLAKLLASLIFPQIGTISINGMNNTNTENYWNIRKITGIVFSNAYEMLLGSTVLEEMTFGLINLGKPPDNAKRISLEYLELFGLAEFEKSNSKNLSDSQIQKLVLASVLVMQPKFLILDEAFSNLDSQDKLFVIEILKKLNIEQNLTVVNFHPNFEFNGISNRLIILHEGKILYDVNPAKIDEILENKDELISLGIGDIF